MRTRLTYENGALNPHVSRIGLFWDVSGMGLNAVPVLWALVERCRYGWHHRLDIGWTAEFRIVDADGNERALEPGCRNTETGTLIEPTSQAVSGSVVLHQAVSRPDLRLLVCRNRRTMAFLPLGMPGSQPLALPQQLVFQLDCQAELGDRIRDRRGTGFSLSGLAALTVRLQGGAPGPRSTPLTFISHRAEPV